MSQRYNIYYAGQVLEGHAQTDVREKLRKLFKADDATLDKLFSGKAQLLKRECDKDTALKYKQAMEKAGAQPVIKSAEAGTATVEPPPAPTATQQREPTAAERIAALAAAEDVSYKAPAPSTQQESTRDYDGKVEPVGSDILRAYERRPEAEQVLPSPNLALDEAGARLGRDSPPPPPAPAVDHLDMAETGELIPNLPPRHAPVHPDTDSINLAAEGTDLADCAPPPAQAPAVDLSGMDMAPAGSDVLEEQYRRRDEAQAPATDHINLAD
jgi:hypothetical protein